MQNAIEPLRPRREPAVDAIDRILRHDVTQEHIGRRRISRIEQRITPDQLRAADAEDAPASEATPFANGDDDVRNVGTFAIAPAEVARITTCEKAIRSRDAPEERAQFGRDLVHDLELPAARQPFAARDRFDRIPDQVADAVRHRLDRVAAEKADGELAMRVGGEAVVEGDLATAENIVEMLRRPRQDAGRAAADLAHRA